MYKSMQDMADKADYEGGWAEFFLGYNGPWSEDEPWTEKNLPKDAPEGLADDLNEFGRLWERIRKKLDPWT